MKRIFNIIIIIFIIVIIFIPSALAVDSTPSASIKAKLDILKQEIASKAAKLKQEINQKLQNKAYVGTVKLKSDSTITLASGSGLKLVTVNQDTIYETKSKKSKYSLKNLAEEDYVAALGDVDETNTLIAKKIILQPDPTKDVKVVSWGQVISLSEKLVIKTKDMKSITVSTSKETDIKTGDFVIVVGKTQESQILNADFIYVISDKKKP